jgi:septal ring-binding cell division protein DamX
MKDCRQYTSLSFLALFFLLLAAFAGCTRPASTGSAEREMSRPPEPAEESTQQPVAEIDESIYDLEEEMPEEDTVEPEELEERIEPIVVDTVLVEEVAAPEPIVTYGIGYRVQILASGERGAAESLKAKAEGEIAMPVYIEFEDGYYKVRVGDFATRDEAAAARSRLSELYPDCWIVSTTIHR